VKALVTGGGGFIGRRIVEMLLEQGHEVHFLARSQYPEVEALGATAHVIDIRNPTDLISVVKGVDVLFHVASKAGVWGTKEAYYSTNVEGTRALLDAAIAAHVPRFIYTSTPSVVGYESDIINGQQDLPYAKHHRFHYPASKTIAEKMVLAANGPKIATVAIRPHLVFGPGDNHTLPGVVSRAQANKLIQVGDGSNLVDVTYVDNAAGAHIDAMHALKDHTSAPAGRAYFIGNDEPVVLWDWIGTLVHALGLPGPRVKLPLWFATILGTLFEWVWTIFKLDGQPRITRMIAAGVARSHCYDMEPAKRDLGYTIRVNMEEGTARTVAWLKEQR
jgi:nucleoside-diphosphate-sugar epimerase